MTVGAIEVTIQPVRIDAAGAVFRVSLNTHSTDLAMPLSGKLDVDGVAWEGGTWTGTAPGGHHREGELRFAGAGPARGTAQLEINGLAKPIIGVWQLSKGT